MLKYADSIMHYNYAWHTKSIYPSKYVYTTDMEVIRQNVHMQELWLLVSVVTLIALKWP